MPNPLNVPITPPRVAFIDSRSGTVSREWYMFFLSLFQSTAGSSVSLDDLQKGPPSLTVDEIDGLIRKVGENLAPVSGTSELQAELDKVRQELQLLPRQELGTMAALQQDNVPWLRFDTTPEGYPTGTAAAGTLYWDDADGIKTLNLVMEDSGGVIQQIGEETYYRIKADSAITNGQVVMFTGTVGASGALKGAPATGLTAFQNEYIMGVATQDIAHNGWGYVTWFGLVRGINTTGGAEAWVDGQILYYNPAVPGGLTKTVPTAPNPKVIVASVVNAASNGSLFVRPTFGSALGSTDSNVQIGTLANGNLLIYNASTSRWENATLTAGTNVTITNGPGSITINSSNPGGTVTSVGLSAPTGFSVSGSPVTSSGTLALSFAAGYSLPTTASQTNWDTAYSERQQWDGGSTNLVAATGRTSLGATTVGSNLFTLANPSAIRFLRINADNTVSALDAATFRTAIGAGTGNGTVTSVDVSGGTTGLTTSGGPVTSSGTITLAGTLGVANGGTGTSTAFTAGSVVFAGASGVYSQKNASFFWDNTNNRLGLGTASPATGFHLFNTTARPFTAGNNSATWTFGPSGTNFAFRENSASSDFIIIDGNNGNTGIGITPSYRLDVQSNVATQTSQIKSRHDTSGDILLRLWIGLNTLNTSSYLIDGINEGQSGSGRVFVVYGNGNVQNANNSYGSLSDIKIKENVVDATPKLDTLMKVRVRNYNLIGDTRKQIGVIAQELESVFPGLVDETVDTERVTKTRVVKVPSVEVDENGLLVDTEIEQTQEYTEDVPTGTVTKSVKYSVFVPILIKAMQEQQIIIDQLKADVMAMKGM